VQYILKRGKYPCSPTYLNSTWRKFLPPGANLKKNRGNVFCISWEINTLYYILFCAGTCLNLLLYISKHTFLIFPARKIKKNEPIWTEGHSDLHKIRFA